MDKETLSNYGWIVICVLVLAVMLAFATPFGTFIAGAIKSTTAGLFDVNQAALGSAGINVDDLVFENCDHLETEVRNATDTYSGDTCCKACGAVLQAGQTVRAKVPEGGKYTAADGTVYNPGDEMPEVVTTGDIYTYGNYEYRYNQYLNGSNWSTNASQNGWGVKCVNNVVDPGLILKQINGNPITCLRTTFKTCPKITVIPEIPATVTNMDFAFSGCTSLTDLSSFIIPNSVTTVWGTFTNCTGLTKAPAIPNSIPVLRTTFEGCTSLTADGLPQLSEGLEQMTGTFSGCTNLEDLASYNIPSTVTSMDNTFINCSKLSKTPKIPANVTRMSYAFYGCTSLTVDNLPVLPSGLTNMSHTYENCTSLTNLGNYTIPNTVTNMESTFAGCSSLTKAPAISTGATSIDKLFYNCSLLSDASKFSIPSGVSHLTSVFENCTSLTDMSHLIIGNNTRTMRRTFYGCSSLTTAPKSIPNSVYQINQLFYGCSSLTGEIQINALCDEAHEYANCFTGTTKPITLTCNNGIDLEKFASTAENGNVTVQK